MAGWRGLAGGVPRSHDRRTVNAAACARRTAGPGLRPRIGPRQFEVGAEVLQAFGADPRGRSGASSRRVRRRARAGRSRRPAPRDSRRAGRWAAAGVCTAERSVTYSFVPTRSARTGDGCRHRAPGPTRLGRSARLAQWGAPSRGQHDRQRQMRYCQQQRDQRPRTLPWGDTASARAIRDHDEHPADKATMRIKDDKHITYRKLSHHGGCHPVVQTAPTHGAQDTYVSGAVRRPETRTKKQPNLPPLDAPAAPAEALGPPCPDAVKSMAGQPAAAGALQLRCRPTTWPRPSTMWEPDAPQKGDCKASRAVGPALPRRTGPKARQPPGAQTYLLTVRT